MFRNHTFSPRSKNRACQLSILSTVVVCCLLPSSVRGDDGDGTLFWGNGDSLNGSLVSAAGDTLIWKSPFFTDPLTLDLSVLSALRFPELETNTPAATEPDDFRITLIDNNVMDGRLVAIDKTKMTFKSQRHGRFVLLREGIRNLQRKENKGMVYLGPRGLDGWDDKQQPDGVPSWKVEDDGSLTTLKGEATLSRKIELPQQCEIEFVLTSSTIPDFVMMIGGDGGSRPRLEMWGDSFVARAEKDFVELQVVPESLRKLHIFAFLDFDKSIMAVYSHTGKKLGELKAKGWDRLANQIVLEAIDSDLTLRHLRISEWDGSIPQALGKGDSRVHTRNGRILSGEIVVDSGSSKTLRVAVERDRGRDKQPPAPDKRAASDEADVKTKGDQAVPDDDIDVIEIPFEEISRVVISTAESPSADVGKTVIAWRDGGYLSGQLMAMDHESVTLATEFSVDPIRSTLAAVRRIGLPNTHDPQQEPDKLFFDGGSLSGTLTVEDNEIPIRWTPVGGRNATSLVSGGNARFQRGAEPQTLAIDSQQFPDVIYLRDGDVFPCRTEVCDKEHLRIVSPVTDVRQLDVSLVKAMEFGNSQRDRQQGFAKDQWKKLKGTVAHYDTAISFTSSSAYGHETVMTGDALSFRIKWKATCYGNITFHLFAEKLRNPQSATPINLLLQPSQIVVSNRVPEPNGRMAFFGFNGNGAAKGTVPVNQRDVAVEIVAQDGQAHVSINGTEVNVFPLNSSGAGARGLVITSVITSVNSRNAQTLKNGVRGLVEIDDFLVRNLVGASVKQFVAQEARERALTVPRFRRDDPPTHVLLAPNGDLLRGRLVSVTKDDVVFESRLEEFRFPRSRVASVIWLATENAATSTPKRPPSAVQARLDNGFTLTMTPERMSEGQLLGTSSRLGTCRIPAKAIRDLFLGNPDSRDGNLSYVRWIRRDAAEPEWDLAENGEESPASEMVGQTMEDFELPTLDGETFRLSEYADRVVVLDFWATWCGPCVAALPEYVKAVDEFDPPDVIFVAVNLEESPERISEFLERHHLSPTVALDRGSVIAKRFQVSGIPHSVVLAPGGVVKHVTVGYKKGVGETTRDRIRKILSDTDK